MFGKSLTRDTFGVGKPIGGYHGTIVSGIVAANAANTIGVTGSAPETELVDCRVFNAYTNTTSFGDMLAALTYSADINCDIANISLGAYPISREAFGSFYGKVLNAATEYALRNGTLPVVAAGNQAANLQKDNSFLSLPAEAAGVLSVSAIGPIGFHHGAPGLQEPIDTPASYTNYGTNAIDIAAPGGNYSITSNPRWYYDMVLNTYALPNISNGQYQGTHYGYTWASGTSMAAPQVTGAAALLKSLNPQANPKQLKSTLKRTADTNYPSKKAYYGAGVVSPYSALTE